jgi:hypothetical protein
MTLRGPKKKVYLRRHLRVLEEVRASKLRGEKMLRKKEKKAAERLARRG